MMRDAWSPPFRDALERIVPWPDPAPPIGPGEYAARLDRARALLEATGHDALLVGAGASLRYFTGVDWMPSERLVAMLLPRDGAAFLICPAFELGSLTRSMTVPMDVRCWEEDEDPVFLAASAIRHRGRLAVDPELPFRITEAARRLCLNLSDGDAVIGGCRRIKSVNELALMQQAMSMTLEVQRITAGILRPGMTASQVRQFIDAAHRALGAPAGSSFCAVQFGQATAYPHGVPGEQVLGERDLVLVDTGCILHGYHSDITRTYAFGVADPDQARIWAIEREAQAAAFDAVRPGVTCASVDQAGRDVLERYGLGPDYRLPGLPHRTGHGIGLSIHEPAYLVRGDTTILMPGMCFSIEPMIVVPDRFGIRLEDHVVVTETGARWFTLPARSIESPFA
ncbi:M24 family metallopeptidase [Lichenicola cladoniae]|nr:Xaa-Pro peptidase family protein [Lichenicola cladoniae]